MRKVKNRNGEGNIMPNGYLRRMEHGVSQSEHVRIAQRALGKPLPKGAQVHHVDENKLNNAPSNLVICPNPLYHRLLHKRMDSLQKCGHADWRKCRFCKKYDAPENLYISVSNVHHLSCMTAYYRDKRKEK